MTMIEGTKDGKGESRLLGRPPVTGLSNLPVFNHLCTEESFGNLTGKMEVPVSLFHLGLEPNHGSWGFMFLLYKSISLKIALGSQ